MAIHLARMTELSSVRKKLPPEILGGQNFRPPDHGIHRRSVVRINAFEPRARPAFEFPLPVQS
jgi:hypothetical protein